MGKLNWIFFCNKYCKTFILKVAQIFFQVEKIPKIDGEIAAYKMSELIGRPVVTF